MKCELESGRGRCDGGLRRHCTLSWQHDLCRKISHFPDEPSLPARQGRPPPLLPRKETHYRGNLLPWAEVNCTKFWLSSSEWMELPALVLIHPTSLIKIRRMLPSAVVCFLFGLTGPRHTHLRTSNADLGLEYVLLYWYVYSRYVLVQRDVEVFECSRSEVSAAIRTERRRISANCVLCLWFVRVFSAFGCAKWSVGLFGEEELVEERWCIWRFGSERLIRFVVAIRCSAVAFLEREEGFAWAGFDCGECC